MAGYLHEGFASEVLGLFKSVMAWAGHVGPNEFVLTTAISSASSCSGGGRVREGRQCHGYAVKSGLVFHAHVKNALVHMYSRCSSVEEALRVFDTVPGCDVFAYNSVLSGLLERGRLREAAEVLRTMLRERVAWDSVTCVTVFGLCSSLGSLGLGLQVHCRVLKADIERDSFVDSSIMDMYGKCGNLGNALKVFERLRTSNVVSWTTIMAACFQNGRFEEALNLFVKMRLQGIILAQGLDELIRGIVSIIRWISGGWMNKSLIKEENEEEQKEEKEEVLIYGKREKLWSRPILFKGRQEAISY